LRERERERERESVRRGHTRSGIVKTFDDDVLSNTPALGNGQGKGLPVRLLGLDVVLCLKDDAIAVPRARADTQKRIYHTDQRYVSRDETTAVVWGREVLGAALMALARPRLSSLLADMSKMNASGMSCGSSRSSGIV
jgi:hypothetical protein